MIYLNTCDNEQNSLMITIQVRNGPFSVVIFFFQPKVCCSFWVPQNDCLNLSFVEDFFDPNWQKRHITYYRVAKYPVDGISSLVQES